MELLDHEAEALNVDNASSLNDNNVAAESPVESRSELIVESASESLPELPEAETADEALLPADDGETAELPAVEDDEALDLRKATAPELIQRLTEIAALDAEMISADEVGRIKQQFYHILKSAAPVTEAAEATEESVAESAEEPAPTPEEEAFKALLAQIKEKKSVYRARIEAEQLTSLEKKRAIIDEINSISADTDNVNRHYPRVKDLQAEFKNIGEVPQQATTEVWKSYQDAVEHFYDQWKVNKELRDYDFKKNLSEKQLIIDEAGKLTDEPDVVVAFRRLQELHDKWREIGPVAKEFRDEIWATFKDVSATISKHYQAFFEERKKREQENEAAKTALCERIEAIDFDSLKRYADWNNATQQILQAQEEWKKLGYASRKVNNALFARFRQRCDAFFAAKAEFFHSLKDDMTRNLEAKIALCEEAEALKDSTEWKKTSDKIVELQKKWKTIGTVPKKQSDLVWNRFLAACDYFFQQKKAATSSARKTEQANLAAKRQIVDELTALNSPEATTPRPEAIERVNELRAQWQATGHVPFREKDKLHDVYREVVRQLFDKYDIHETKARQASFEASIEELSADKQKLSRERERLMRVYESKRSELQTYENNLGFFNSKTKSGDSMIQELNRKIQRLKADIADLEGKIVLIDSKL